MTEDNKLVEEQRENLNRSIKFNPSWKFREIFPTISAYVTSYNCVSGGYPIEKAIRSFAWTEQLIVVDGGSTDGTKELLERLQKEIPHLEIYDIPIDWENPGKDGNQKAMARAMCTSEFCIQFDADEICLGNPIKWKKIAKDMMDGVDIVDLMVLEPFGSPSSLRLNKEHNPIKWRIYRNCPEITHGIPKHDRFERDGKIYSKGGSDGCDPIHVVTEMPYPSQPHETARRARALFNQGDPSEYKDFICEKLKDGTPMVLHLGHVDLVQKISLYLNSWHEWWNHLYGHPPSDPNHNQYFPMTPIESCNQVMIDSKVRDLILGTPSIDVPELLELDVWEMMP